MGATVGRERMGITYRAGSTGQGQRLMFHPHSDKLASGERVGSHMRGWSWGHRPLRAATWSRMKAVSSFLPLPLGLPATPSPRLGLGKHEVRPWESRTGCEYPGQGWEERTWKSHGPQQRSKGNSKRHSVARASALGMCCVEGKSFCRTYLLSC